MDAGGLRGQARARGAGGVDAVKPVARQPPRQRLGLPRAQRREAVGVVYGVSVP